MKTKRLIAIVAMLTLAVACVFAMSSCDFVDGLINGGMHEHSYRVSNNTATCTDRGTATYVCDCGDTYSETVEASGHTLVSHAEKAPTCTEAGNTAYQTCSVCSYTTFTTVSSIGHDYLESIVRYPSTKATGVKKLVCSRCDDTVTEDIEAVSFSLPSVAEFIAASLDDGTYSIKADENTQIITVRELDDYTYSSNAYKRFFAFRLAEAALTVSNSSVNGTLKLELGVSEVALSADVSADEAEKPNFEDVLTLEIFLNGDAVSVSAYENNYKAHDEDYDLRKVFYTAVAESIGMTYGELVEVGYITDKAAGYLPLIGELLQSIESIELPEASVNLPAILSVIGVSLVNVTEGENGTVYTFDTDALSALVEDYGYMTVAEMLDAQYGEGTSSALSSMLIGLPDMTVKQIADYAIALAENCDLSINDVYAFISLLIYQATDVTVDIEQEISDRYTKTLTEIIVEIMKGSDADLDETTAANTIKSGITGAVTTIMASDINGLYHLAYCDAADHESDTCTVATDSLKAILVLAKNAATISVTVNAEGFLTAFELGFTDPTDNESIINVNYAEADGETTVTVAADAYEAVINSKSGLATVTVKEDGAVIIDGSVAYTDTTADLDLRFFAGESDTATLALDYSASALSAKLTAEVESTSYDLLVLTAALDENGKITEASVEAYELNRSSNDVAEGETATDATQVILHEKVLEATYTNIEAVVDLEIIADDVTAALHSEKDLLSVYILQGEEDYLLRVYYEVTESSILTAVDINTFEAQYEKQYNEELGEYVDVYVGDVLTDLFDFYYADNYSVATVEICVGGTVTMLTLVEVDEYVTDATVSITENGVTVCEGTSTFTKITKQETDATTGETVTVVAGFMTESDLVYYDTYVDENEQTVTDEIEFTVKTELTDNGYAFSVMSNDELVFGTMLVVVDGIVTRYVYEVNDPENNYSNVINIDYSNDRDNNKVHFIYESQDGIKLEQTVTYGEGFVTYDYLNTTDGRLMADYTVTVTDLSTDSESAFSVDFDFDKYVLEISDEIEYVEGEITYYTDLPEGAIPVYPLPDGDFDYDVMWVTRAIRYFIANGRVVFTFVPAETEGV